MPARGQSWSPRSERRCQPLRFLGGISWILDVDAFGVSVDVDDDHDDEATVRVGFLAWLSCLFCIPEWIGIVREIENVLFAVITKDKNWHVQ